MKTRKYTISDVAKKAGVSVSTVSRILNNKSDVADKTREHVQSVMKELGYKPLLGARQLRDRKTRNIALVFPLNSSVEIGYTSFHLEFILAASTAAGEEDYLLSVLTHPVDESTLINLYESSHVDGIVLMQVHEQDWRVDLLRSRNYPFVMIGHCANNEGLSYLDLDYENSIIEAFHYLIELGHQQIGFIGASEELIERGFGPALRSWRGYQKILSLSGMTPLYRKINETTDLVQSATLSMLAENPKMTAIVTIYGSAPIYIMNALSSRGLSVPDDISILSIVNNRIAKIVTPMITHINFPVDEVGYEAVKTLVAQLDGNMPYPKQVLIPPQLVIGETTSPPLQL